jgi:hypothetical protein
LSEERITFLFDSVYAIDNRMLADARSAIQTSKFLVDFTIAVIIKKITGLIGGSLELITFLRHTFKTVVYGVLTFPFATGRCAHVLVSVAVAVVIQQITDFVALSFLRITDLLRTVGTVADRMFTNPLATGGLSQSVIHNIVAVVVKAIAGFHVPGIPQRILRPAIFSVGNFIAINIRIAEVPKIILVKIALIVIGGLWTIIGQIGHSIAIIIIVKTIGCAVIIQVRVTFIHLVITIVILAIAQFFHSGMDF